MNPVMFGNLLVPLNSSRHNYKNLACGLLNVNNLSYTHGTLISEEATKLKEAIQQFKGTVLYIHKRFKVYGIVKDSAKGTKPILYWVQEKHVKEIKDQLLNYNEKMYIIDISHEPIEIFRGKYKPDIFSAARPSDGDMKVQMAYTEFIKDIKSEIKHVYDVQGGESSIVVDTPIKNDDTSINNENIHENDDIETFDLKTDNVKYIEESGVKEDSTTPIKNDDTGINKEEDISKVITETAINESRHDSEESDATTSESETMAKEGSITPIKNDDTGINKEENINQVNEPATVEDSEHSKINCEAGLENSELMKALIEATKALNETREELHKTAESYKESMAKSFGDFSLDVETKFIGVNSIKGSLSDTDSAEVFSDSVGTESVYEFILKIMKVDDSISLPRTFYEKLTTVIKRNMMLSRDGNKYDSIVLIRFDRTSKDNLIARVEYDITKDYTRVTIIKQFNSVELTSGQLLDYETKFNQWRRMHSYRTSY